MPALFHLDKSGKAEIVIIGAGITGSFLAERLTRSGHEVVGLDLHQPYSGSTAASTALLQWEIDKPMLQLEQDLGFGVACRVYQRSFEAVRDIGNLLANLGGAKYFIRRNTLFFSGTALGPGEMKEECKLRKKASLPTGFVDRDTLIREHGFTARRRSSLQGLLR
jgi:hypothetical protein